MEPKGHIRIGTSNATVPGNKSSFPPEYRQTTRLHYYSSIFNTVEVNSCFYKTPKHSTYKKWSLDVPDDFQFTLKLSKVITHAKELENDLSCMNEFIHTAGGTGNKKGCVLLQFPGKISLDHFEKVEMILDYLEQSDPQNEWRKAVEFRNSSWYVGETWELLDEFSAAMVLHDMRKGANSEFRGNAEFVYLRFHGPKGDYRDSYPDSFLREKADLIRSWLKQGKDVYAYFNNTMGSAYENALSLKRMLEK